MTGKAGWKDTIENVDAAQDAIDQVLGCADSHQIARFAFGQERRDHLQRGVHLLLGLAHRESADGDAGRIERSDEISGGRAQVPLYAALDDPEQSLVRPPLRLQAAFRPAMRPLHSDFGVGVVVGIGALVERHDDVRAEVLLNGNGLLGGEAMRRAVNVTLERHAVIVDLAGLRQREDLKAARVGEHRTRPLHEPVQAAHVAHELVAGPQVEMVGIAQDERRVDILELFGRERLDCPLRADGCEDRREEVPMRSGEDSRAGAVVFCGNGEFEHWGDYTIFDIRELVGWELGNGKLGLGKWVEAQDLKWAKTSQV